MFNRTVIIGRLGQDPEVAKTANNTEVVTFSLADHVKIGEREETQWHKIKTYGKQASACSRFLAKGDLCCVEGRLDTHSYEKDGVTHKAQTIIAERVIFLSPKRQANAPATVSADENDIAEQSETSSNSL